MRESRIKVLTTFRFILALALPLAAQPPLVWFSPLDPIVRQEVGYGGSPQYVQLFDPAAPWTQAASRVQVFKIYPQWITQATDAHHDRVVAKLTAHRTTVQARSDALTARLAAIQSRCPANG